MAIVYSVSMNKGGVGKTSLVTNLAAAISVQAPDKRVLIVDTDGQGNSSIAFGRNPNDFKLTTYDLFLGGCALSDVTIQLTDNLDLAPANDALNFLEFDVLIDVQKYGNPLGLLKPVIDAARPNYDYIFIDTPPSLGLVSGNVLACADRVIIPFVPETFAVQGLIRVIEAINDFREKTNPALDLAGVVGMMVDQRTTLHSEMLQKARQYCDSREIRMFETVIPRSIRFANSTAYSGKPAVLTDGANPIVAAYYELLTEVLENEPTTVAN